MQLVRLRNLILKMSLYLHIKSHMCLKAAILDKAALDYEPEGTGKSVSYGMWNHPRGHVWNVFVRPASS